MGDPQRARQVSLTMLGLSPVWLLAYVLTEAVFGRTLGKKLVGIVVRVADGRRASPGVLLLRWAAKFVWLLIGPLLRTVGKLGPGVGDPIVYVTWVIALIGFAWAARSARQALWDKVAGTAVFRG
jgi:uncharacterized RDD family membrane protein YckC